MQYLEKKGFLYKFNPTACDSCGGKCCIGESGYIWLSTKEIEDISSFLNLDIFDFKQKYTKSINGKISLIENKLSYNNYSCIFFNIKKKQCLIYQHRPTQCKTYPFWDSMKDENIQRIARECDGIVLD
jgi:Fe-S-cluster containining protein